MNNGSDHRKIQATLDIARRQINQGKGKFALQTLRGIKNEIDGLEGTVEWVEFSLTVGEAFLTDREVFAETHLQDAGEKLGKLVDPPPDLVVRVYERLGDFYNTVPPKNLERAKEYLSIAKRAAILLGVEEVTANIGLKILSLDLRINKRPEYNDSQTLRRVAGADGYTAAEQLRAWSCHLGKLEESRGDLQFARGIDKANESYFRELLRGIREGENERLGE